MLREYVHFASREARSRFVLDRFGGYLRDSVLDVGCFEAPLRSLLGGDRYTGIDIVGSPDLIVDLDRAVALPFQDGSFATTICIDVLEHLDSFHTIFDELFRVSRNYVIVSLPNCWSLARGKIARGRGAFSHYGLPFEKPVDRHKWFFNVTQILSFLDTKAHDLGVPITELVVLEKPRNPIIRIPRRVRYSREAYDNRYAHSVFAVFEKRVFGHLPEAG